MRLMFAAAAAAAILASSGGAGADTRIGSAAIIKNDVSGVLGPNQRPIKSGDGVFQDETVATGKDSNAQLLFIDETTLSIGAESKVVLDKVVFDPEKKTGEVTLRTVSGAFRFVTGSAPKQGYTIKTPAGTIGVRGTILTWTIVGDVLTLWLHEGSTVFCLTPDNCKVLDKPGTYIIVTGNQVSATQVWNALGCGAGKCNEYSYNQGDKTYYIAYFSDGRHSPPEGTRAAELVEQCHREFEHHHHHHKKHKYSRHGHHKHHRRHRDGEENEGYKHYSHHKHHRREREYSGEDYGRRFKHHRRHHEAEVTEYHRPRRKHHRKGHDD